MNRTNEYLKLIELTNILQEKIQTTKTKNTFTEIETSLSFLEKQKTLDQFVTEQKLKKIKNLISDLKKDFTAKNESEKIHLQNVLEITDSKVKKYLLRINKLSRQRNASLVEDVKRREAFTAHLEQEQVLEKKIDQEENVLRKRMITQLNELGQMVSDISLHVSLQGEEIKRIDEVVDESNNFVKEAIYEINKTWGRVSDQRKRIFKFFGFWLLLAFIFWIWRKK